jgi:putative sterol carrier protein
MIWGRKTIEIIMKQGIERMNNDPDFKVAEVFLDSTRGDASRTCRIIITDDDDEGDVIYDTTLGYKDGNIVEIHELKPTVTYRFNTSTWLHLISQNYEFRQLFFLGKFKVEGESMLRDYIVWSKFWKKYHDLLKLNFYQRMVLKPSQPI